MKKIPLPNSLESPKWWMNFIYSCDNRLTIDNVNDYLAPHHAKFHITGKTKRRSLEFETEGDYTMFVLKFS